MFVCCTCVCLCLQWTGILVTVMTEGTVGTIETTGTVLVPVVTELTVMTQVKMCVGGNFLLVKSLT